jgi:hypothetical protein
MPALLSLLADDRVRLSRLIAVPSGLLAIAIFIYGIFAPDSFITGTWLAILFASISICVWKLGDWWKLRQALRKAQEGMPRPINRRGFDVVSRTDTHPED